MSPEDKLQRWWNDPRYRREAHTECSDLMAYLMDVVVATVNEDEALRSSQTRWVKCSERMPTIVNQPEFAYITIVHVKSKQEDLLSMGMVLCDLQDGKLIPAGPGFLPLGWEVVAWLDNVPRYEP